MHIDPIRPMEMGNPEISPMQTIHNLCKTKAM